MNHITPHAEPDPTTSDPVAYLKVWIDYARARLRERRHLVVQVDRRREVRVNG